MQDKYFYFHFAHVFHSFRRLRMWEMVPSLLLGGAFFHFLLWRRVWGRERGIGVVAKEMPIQVCLCVSIAFSFVFFTFYFFSKGVVARHRLCKGHKPSVADSIQPAECRVFLANPYMPGVQPRSSVQKPLPLLCFLLALLLLLVFTKPSLYRAWNHTYLGMIIS